MRSDKPLLPIVLLSRRSNCVGTLLFNASRDVHLDSGLLLTADKDERDSDNQGEQRSRA